MRTRRCSIPESQVPAGRQCLPGAPETRSPTSALHCGFHASDPQSPAARHVAGALAGQSDVAVADLPPDFAERGLAPHDLIVVAVAAERLVDDLALVSALRTHAPGCPLVAAFDRLDAAQIDGLLAAGVCDFVSTASPAAEIIARIRRAAGALHSVQVPGLGAATSSRIKDFVGTSPAFLRQVAKVPTLAGCDSGVLILGETGTGKEVCARAIHYLSARASKPWVALNCGAIPTELIESELFGHVKGAFTMAFQARRGLVSEAESGTLFLDDIDCLPVAAQAKLLRFLEQREYRPVGSNTLCHSDVRVIAASNDRLPELAARGAFRRDLYFRLSVLALKLPPLRERREDIALLATHFMRQFAREFGRGVTGLSPSARYKLLLHAWPGNVRELRHVVERAVLLCAGTQLEPDDIDIDIDGGGAGGAPTADASFRDAKSRVVETFERSYIELVLARCNGNITQAARVARKNRRAFFELMRKHRIEPDRFRAHPAP